MGILLDGNHESKQSTTQQIRDIFIPELFQRGRTATPRLGSTAWLDGLRGCAALCVVLMHLTVFSHDGIELCYGSKHAHNDELNTTWAALPIIRLPFTGGHFSVMLFFVISGYVVPRRLISHLQGSSGNRLEFFDDMQSAMVRRPIRLYMPVLLCTFAIALLWHLLGIRPNGLPKQSNMVSEVFAWILETSLFTYFYRFGWLFSYYNVHTWTIPVEMRGSMFLFVYLMIVQGISTKLRVYSTLGMTLYLAIAVPGAWYACFFSGMFMSEVDMLASEGSNLKFVWSGIGNWMNAKSNQGAKSIIMHVLLLFSLHLATQPSSDLHTKAELLGTCPGWVTLSKLIPFHYIDLDTQYRWYWLFWGAALMVFVVREISWMRGACESQFAQYLGRHSFALYLIHGPMISYFSENLLYIFGFRHAWSDELKAQYGSIEGLLGNRSWWPLPQGGPSGLEPNFLLCVIISVPVFLYVAEIATKLFDAPSIKASKYVWQRWRSL